MNFLVGFSMMALIFKLLTSHYWTREMDLVEPQTVIDAITELVSGGVVLAGLLILRRSYREALEVTRKTLEVEKSEGLTLREQVRKLGNKLDDVSKELRRCEQDHHSSQLKSSSLEHRILALEERNGTN